MLLEWCHSHKNLVVYEQYQVICAQNKKLRVNERERKKKWTMRCQYLKVKNTCDVVQRIIKIKSMVKGYSNLVYKLLS